MSLKLTRLLVISLFLISFYYINAQIPQYYYNKAEGQTQEKLKSSLHKVIKDAYVLKYGSGEDHTWHGFSLTDTDSDGNVTDRYSMLSYQFNGYNSVPGMHIEHSFANSWWGGIKNQAFNDLHHLYPSNASANMSKSNNIMAIVDDCTTTDNGVIKVGKSYSRPGETITAWEPADKYKGDFARTYMYMVTCYEDMDTLWQSEGLKMLNNNKYPVFEQWALDLLLNWNEIDPVDEIEKNRNEAVYKIQGNRNPFIDFPELASYIWGKDTTTLFYSNPNDYTPVIFTPHHKEEINIGYADINKVVKCEVTVRGRNITEDLTIKCDREYIECNHDKISYKDIENGSAIIFSLINNTEEGEFNIPVEILYSGQKSEFFISGYLYDTVIALEASKIYSTQNKKAFTANWKSNSPVSLDVYTKVNNENISIEGFPKENIQGEKFEIASLTQNTKYYYTVTANGKITQEKEVYIPEAEPIFSVKYNDLSFTSIPGRNSRDKKIDATIIGVSDMTTIFSTDEPFELSIDSINWSRYVETKNFTPACFIRMEAMENETDAECELIIKCSKIDDERIITLKGEVNKSKSLFEGFEFASKTAYAEAEIFGDDALWSMKCALVGTSESDRKHGKRSVRMNKTSAAGIGELEMISTKNNGIDSLSFFAGNYGSDAVGKLSIEYTTDNGMTWNNIDNLTVTKSWEKYSYYIGIAGNVRLRFRKDDSTRRVNLDDIQISDYAINNALYNKYADKESISILGNEIYMTCEGGCLADIYDLQGIKISRYYSESENMRFFLTPGNYIIKGRYNSKVVSIR